MAGLILDGEVKGLRSRKITDETAKHFGYKVAAYKGKTVQVAPYYNAEGQLIAQKIRGKDKKFTWVGEPKEALPFGAQCWHKTGKMIVVTEGEIDAMAMSQVQGNQWPVVSIASGAGAQTKKYIALHRDYFNGFDKVIIMFDNDEPGRQAARDAAEIIGPKAHIAELPLKDAGEMLEQGKTKELLDAMWRAKKFTPQGIVEIASLKEEVLKGVPVGKPWPWKQLTDMTYGRRRGEMYVIGAATAAGKTDFLTQLAAHIVRDEGDSVGLFFLEQAPKETALRMAGKLVRKILHVDASKDDIAAAWDRLEECKGKTFLYDSFGITDWDDITDRMRYLAHAEGVHDFVLDHITALVADSDDERKALDKLMAQAGGIVKELDCTLYLVSHLATPDGTPHEEGGHISLSQFRGSRAIGFWAHYAFGLERNQQAADETERRTTTLRVVKDRWTGRATGRTISLEYDFDTGMLDEATATAKAHGFTDETEKPSPANTDF